MDRVTCLEYSKLSIENSIRCVWMNYYIIKKYFFKSNTQITALSPDVDSKRFFKSSRAVI